MKPALDTEQLAQRGPSGPHDEHIEALVDEVGKGEGRTLEQLAGALGWSEGRTSLVAEWCLEAGVLDARDAPDGVEAWWLGGARADERVSQRVSVYSVGLAYASACAEVELTADEVAAAVNALSPTGIGSAWRVADDATFATGEPHPCPCASHPETRKHWLLVC